MVGSEVDGGVMEMNGELRIKNVELRNEGLVDVKFSGGLTDS